MAEKTDLSHGNDENSPPYEGRKGSVVDAAVLQGEIFDERYETTQRG